MSLALHALCGCMFAEGDRKASGTICPIKVHLRRREDVAAAPSGIKQSRGVKAERRFIPSCFVSRSSRCASAAGH